MNVASLVLLAFCSTIGAVEWQINSSENGLLSARPGMLIVTRGSREMQIPSGKIAYVLHVRNESAIAVDPLPMLKDGKVEIEAVIIRIHWTQEATRDVIDKVVGQAMKPANPEGERVTAAIQ